MFNLIKLTVCLIRHVPARCPSCRFSCMFSYMWGCDWWGK
jgi:hypothetical protein